MGPFVIQFLVPLSTQPPSTFSARVRVAPMSEPDWSSVKQMVAIFSPRMAGRKQRSRMASEPKRKRK